MPNPPYQPLGAPTLQGRSGQYTTLHALLLYAACGVGVAVSLQPEGLRARGHALSRVASVQAQGATEAAAIGEDHVRLLHDKRGIRHSQPGEIRGRRAQVA